MLFCSRVIIMTLYERIRDLRIKAGMSQDELAHLMGYSDRSMITKIESGKVDISQKKIVAFAQALNTTTGYLMGLDEESHDQIPVFIPDSDGFRIMVKYMSPDDYLTICQIYEKAYNKAKKAGENIR